MVTLTNVLKVPASRGLTLIGPPRRPREPPGLRGIDRCMLLIPMLTTGLRVSLLNFLRTWFISRLAVNLVVLLGILPWRGLYLLSGRETRLICDGRSVVLLVRLRPASSFSDPCHTVTLSVHSNRNEIHNILIAIKREISTHQNRY